MLTFLIMAGGSGERFWPLSTKENPKQILKIFNEKSLIRLTYERIIPLVDNSKIFIATNEIQFEAIKKEIPELDVSRFIIEPAFRDTAAAISYGSMLISKYYDNPTICVLASDHLIADEDEFRKVISLAEMTASTDNIVTLGIKPTYPETGYGYIEVDNADLNKSTKALCFKEKPCLDIAKQYVASKKYLWNSGMFVFRYDTIMSALKKYSSNHYETIMKISKNVKVNNGLTTALSVKSIFLDFEKKSIDYAVMEKANNIKVIPSSFGWNDVGGYLAFEELFEKDTNNNIIRNINCISVDSSNNILVSNEGVQRVSLLGVNDMIIVINHIEILICKKEKNQEIKKILRLI